MQHNMDMKISVYAEYTPLKENKTQITVWHPDSLPPLRAIFNPKKGWKCLPQKDSDTHWSST